MNINEVYKIVSYLVDKYQGTYLSPDDFNMVINMAQRQYLNYMTEDGSGHRGMQMGRKMGTLITTPVVESLSKFMVETTLTVTSQIATQPANLYTTVSVRTSDDTKVVRRITADKLANYLSDPIDPPTNTEPVYIEIGDTYKVYPNTVGSIKVGYVRLPADMKWAYTGNLVYDQANSVQPEWNGKDMEDIIYRAIGIIGINLKDNDLRMAAQIVKQQGE
jgi:hypothetical protein